MKKSYYTPNLKIFGTMSRMPIAGSPTTIGGVTEGFDTDVQSNFEEIDLLDDFDL